MVAHRHQGQSSSAYRACLRAGTRRLVIVLAAMSAVACILAGPVADSAAALPQNNFPPYITQEPGHSPTVGETLLCDSGSWIGDGIAFTYQWLREGVVVREEGGEGANLYKITAADEGYSIACNVIATNSEGSEEEESSNSVAIASKEPKSPPENKTPPEVTGTPTVGSKLKCLPGTWTGHPEPVYTYQWLHEGAAIELQTTNEYTVETADEGYNLACKVTASNGVGSPVPAVSKAVHVTASEPINEEKPRVEGLAEPEVGEALTCWPGVWNDKPTFTYQWLREGSPIASATASIYTASREDVSHRLTCQVTATNSEGKSAKPVVSSNSVRVHGSKPEKVEAPSIEVSPKEDQGSPKVGDKLTCKEGAWTGAPTPSFSYQWLLEGAEIRGAASKTYTIIPEDKGKSLACEVTAENEYGELTVVSKSLTVPVGTGSGKPVNEVHPEVSGYPQQRGYADPGETLTCSPGKWSGSPTSYLYQWVRSEDEGNGWTDIAAATEESYSVGTADEGYLLACSVTAVNDEGDSDPELSNRVPVPGSPPTNISPPQLSGYPLEPGYPKVGETLVCSDGDWSGTPSPSYTYEWLREHAVIASGQHYVIGSEDRGYSISCEVVAKNSQGTESAETGSVHIQGVPPINTTAPKVLGFVEPEVGDTVKCSPGKWAGVPTPTYSYQWLLNGAEIRSATGEAYVVAFPDQGRWLSCKVTASNREGTESTTSNSVHVPGTAPENAESPYMEGTAAVGAMVACNPGVWYGAPPPVLTYEWLVNGAIVFSSTSRTYTPEPAAQGQSLSCNVIGENSEGSAEAHSNSVVVAAGPSKLAHKLVEQTLTTGTVDRPDQTPTTATAAQILSALSGQLTHAQQRARIASLLKHGDYTFGFAAPAAGTLELAWYQVPKGAHVASVKRAAAKPKPVLVASATATFSGAATKVVKLRLTNAGRHLLERSPKRITLTVKGVFVRPGLPSVTWMKTFVLIH